MKKEETLLNEWVNVKPINSDKVSYDTNQSFIKDLIEDQDFLNAITSQVNWGTTLEQSKSTKYDQLDEMFRDPTISAVLQSYINDTLEKADNGEYIWVQSKEPNIQNFVTYLYKSLNLDALLQPAASSLYRYGEVFVEQHTQSEYNKYFGVQLSEEKQKKPLTEALKVDYDTQLSNVLEVVPDPGIFFELTKFGKTACFLQTRKAELSKDSQNAYATYYIQNSNDKIIYPSNRFVHQILMRGTGRKKNGFSINLSNTDDGELIYDIDSGKSLFEDVYKNWKKLSLLEDTIILNRVTRSALIHIFNIEVGDMPREDTNRYLQAIKSQFTQKIALAKNGVADYNSATPLENFIFNTTRQARGSINPVDMGGDANITSASLADLNYFQDKEFGSLGVPKQLYGVTGDSAGFDGAGAIAKQSSRYADTLQTGRNVLIELIEKIININLMERGHQEYIGKFTLHMKPVESIKQTDSIENQRNKIQIINDAINLLQDLDVERRLRIIKAMMPDITQREEVAKEIDGQIEQLKKKGQKDTEKNEDEEGSLDDLDFGGDSEFSDVNTSSSGGEGVDEIDTNYSSENEGEDMLPSPEDLGVDLLGDA